VFITLDKIVKEVKNKYWWSSIT